MLIKKPPIVVVLGHTDHGKTTLLDCIRQTNIALKEAGGITQKIGAYEIEFNKEKITFIDTPGHAAFNHLRERGVKIADLAILVIAADEGLKPQTIESIEYLKASELPFVIALNKIDKKEADVEKVLSGLVEYNVIPEKWGGSTPVVEISALKSQGINDLIELLILLRDINDLKVEIDKPGRGFILETIKDPKRGILASAILNEGKISYGDYLITKTSFCKIKIFEDDLENKIDFAVPSRPFLVGNFNEMPFVGEEFEVGTEKDIKGIQFRLEQQEKNLFKKVIFFNKDAKADYLLILRADHIGSLEALENIFENIASENNFNLKIIKADLGPVTIDDVNLAKNFKSIIISFNVKNQKQVLELIKEFNLVFFESNIIYELEEMVLNYLKNSGNMQNVLKGILEILGVFSSSKLKKTIGGRVVLGKIKINQKFSIMRGEEILGLGKIISLEKNKISVNEVNENELCGLIVETNKDIEIGDKIVVQ